jgi:outer membrane protein assembly factor BamB
MASIRKQVVSSPAVANGNVYFGSEDGEFYAVSASTGRLKWSFLVHAEVDSSPAVVNGVVYFGAWSGEVYALNAATGHELWASATGNSVQFSFPAVNGGRVFIGHSTTASMR